MPKLPIISGRQMIRVLEKRGYRFERQRGSHIMMVRAEKMVVVPNHKEIRKGTLRNIMREANISLNELLRLLK